MLLRMQNFPFPLLTTHILTWNARNALNVRTPNVFVAAGVQFGRERGATSTYVFQATTNRTASGTAVVKVFCVPVSKHGERPPTCSARQTMQFMQASLAGARP